MRVYETAGRPVRWHRTQKEAGDAMRGASGAFRSVDVDTSHAGLVQFLNGLSQVSAPVDIAPELPFEGMTTVGAADEAMLGPNLTRLWTLAQARFRVPSSASLAEQLAAIDRFMGETREIFGYADD